MRKYLTDLYVPASGVHLNVYLPENKRIGEVTQLLVKITDSLCAGSYHGTVDAMLLDAETGVPYQVTETVNEAGIRSSSRLILI